MKDRAERLFGSTRDLLNVFMVFVAVKVGVGAGVGSGVGQVWRCYDRCR